MIIRYVGQKRECYKYIKKEEGGLEGLRRRGMNGGSIKLEEGKEG